MACFNVLDRVKVTIPDHSANGLCGVVIAIRDPEFTIAVLLDKEYWPTCWRPSELTKESEE
jgi:hypothetical protein